jgi:hypothetical protein
VPGLLAAVLAQLTESDERGRITPYVVAFAVGFFIAVAGHMMQSRPLILTGIIIAGTASALSLLVLG